MNRVGRHAEIEEADQRHFRRDDAHERRASFFRHPLQIAAAAIGDESGELTRGEPVEIGTQHEAAGIGDELLAELDRFLWAPRLFRRKLIETGSEGGGAKLSLPFGLQEIG